MSVNVWDAPIYEVCGEDQTINVAGTPSNYQQIRPGFREVKLVCDTAWRLGLAPKLVHCLYYAAAAGTYTEYTTYATDTLTTTHVPLDGMLATDYLYLGTSTPVLGFYFNIGTAVQDEAATLDFEYCSTAMSATATLAFTDVAGDSDQTDVAGDTLKQDGEYVFTYVDAKRSRLGTYQSPLFSKCHWYRFKPSATLTATTDILGILPIYKSATDLAYMSAAVEYNIGLDTAQVGGWYAQCSAEKHLYISWIR